MNLNLAGNNALKQPQTAMCSQVNKDASEAVALLVLTSLSKKQNKTKKNLSLAEFAHLSRLASVSTRSAIISCV